MSEVKIMTMIQKSKFTFKVMILLSAVGLACSVPFDAQKFATAVELRPSSLNLERPSATPEPSLTQVRPVQLVASGTDTLTLDAESVRSSTAVPTANWEEASFPVEDFQAYTSAFGYRMSPTGGYSQEFHSGLDMAAPERSNIRNWWAGTVKEVSDDTACGTSVVVQSGDWTATYCHMQGYVETSAAGSYMVDVEGGLKIKQGQQVAAGTRIGRVGMTGRTTGPHLHWTLKYSGTYVDPGLVLRAMYQDQIAAGR